MLLRTAVGSRLARAADGGLLVFEIGELGPDSETGRSVVVTGIASVKSLAAGGDASASTGGPGPLPDPWRPVVMIC